MTGNPDFRRYLVNIDSVSTQQLFTDCLVIGAGIRLKKTGIMRLTCNLECVIK